MTVSFLPQGIREPLAGFDPGPVIVQAQCRLPQIWVLLQHRGISREVLDAFVRAKLVYESAEPSADGSKDYHNAVFIGCDEHGVARHAHKRGLYTFGEGFKRNVTGCDSRYSFHCCGTDDQLYVFEAPVDMLSFITVHPEDWHRHSYVSLCGTSQNAMMWMLEQNPNLRQAPRFHRSVLHGQKHPAPPG